MKIKMNNPPDLNIRIYYEDTDAGGVTYYANYLKYAERARTEWIRHIMRRKDSLWSQNDPLFVVRHLEVDYNAPARLDDSLKVTTNIIKIGGASFDMLQNIYRNEDLLVALKVTLVAITHNGKVMRIPSLWRNKLEQFI
jgi:acyl-CoA thioester hydrolase